MSKYPSSRQMPDQVTQIKSGKRIAVIIPAWNEVNSIPNVLADIPSSLVDEIIVVDNNSTDATAVAARDAGATVLHEEQQGYGAACLKGLAYVFGKDFDIVVFIDADYSDHPEEMSLLVEKITQAGYDLVIGSRSLGNRERGAMPPQAVFGNWLSTSLIRLIWGMKFTDLGPFRAITVDALRKISMVDTNYGWTVEMQIKATRFGLRATEVPVSYRKRIGVSKISGTFSGSIRAGWKILSTIARYGLAKKPPGSP